MTTAYDFSAKTIDGKEASLDAYKGKWIMLQVGPGDCPKQCTDQLIAMRQLREPDAFPAADIGLMRALEVEGVRPSPAELLARAGLLEGKTVTLRSTGGAALTTLTGNAAVTTFGVGSGGVWNDDQPVQQSTGTSH